MNRTMNRLRRRYKRDLRIWITCFAVKRRVVEFNRRHYVIWILWVIRVTFMPGVWTSTCYATRAPTAVRDMTARLVDIPFQLRWLIRFLWNFNGNLNIDFSLALSFGYPIILSLLLNLLNESTLITGPDGAGLSTVA